MWNCRGYRNKQNEIIKRAQDYDIMVLMETKCSQSTKIYISGFRTYCKESMGKSGGVVICVRKELEFDIIKEWENIGNNFDIFGIRMRNMPEKLNIVAVYKRPMGNVQRRKWQEIFGIDTRQNTLFIGDFNAHNAMWNYTDTDINGEELWEETFNHDLVCVNPDTLSRMGETGQIGTNIDLAFAIMNLADKIECEQVADTWGSDHFPIKLNIDTDLQVYTKLTNRISTKRTN